MPRSTSAAVCTYCTWCPYPMEPPPISASCLYQNHRPTFCRW